MAALHSDPIPFITLPNWVKAAQQCGFNIEPIFRELGIQTDLIHLEKSTISQPILEQVYAACMQRSKKHHFPFVLGETFAFEYLPDIETFLTTSPNMREASRVFDWVQELINPMIRMRLDEDGEHAALVLQVAGSAPPHAQPWFVETVFASIVKFGRALLREQAEFRRLTFRHAEPDYAQAYRDYFKVPIAFGAAQDSLEFERRLLDMPLEGGFPALHQQAEYRVEQRLANLPRRPGVVAAMEELFTRKPALLGRGVEHMAAELGLSSRTLQRRLQDSGASFGDVQARVRYRLAIELLEQRKLDLETVSERLGFSDRRSFTRAFARWSGVTPSAFRNRAG